VDVDNQHEIFFLGSPFRPLLVAEYETLGVGKDAGRGRGTVLVVDVEVLVLVVGDDT
jgi:hypothetical protein